MLAEPVSAVSAKATSLAKPASAVVAKAASPVVVARQASPKPTSLTAPKPVNAPSTRVGTAHARMRSAAVFPRHTPRATGLKPVDEGSTGAWRGWALPAARRSRGLVLLFEGRPTPGRSGARRFGARCFGTRGTAGPLAGTSDQVHLGARRFGAGHFGVCPSVW